MTAMNPLLAAALRSREQSAAPQPHVILVYDLHGATPAVYARLDLELAQLQYTKVVENTTWEGRYRAGVSLDDAITTTKSEFAACASRAGAARYHLRVYGSPLPMKIGTASR